MWYRNLGIWTCLALWLFAQIGSCSSPLPAQEATKEAGVEAESRKDASHSEKSSTPEEPENLEAKRESPGDSDAGPADISATPEAPKTPENSPVPEWAQGKPVQAKPGAWTWVDVPGSKCGFGSQTGFALNPSPEASKLLYIYLQGGGACWNRNNPVGGCFNLAPTALYLTGFNKQTFQFDVATQAVIRGFFFDRKSPANVFQKAHYVFVPYCSGDVFAGNSSIKSLLGRTMHFHGHQNLKLFLSRIVTTFPKVTRVMVAGSSAGGFGAALNWGLFQQAFGSAIRVDVIDDSGPPLEPVQGRWKEWLQAWKPSLPPGCNNCNTISGMMEYYKKTLLSKGRKMALISYDRDSVIRTFFGLVGNFGLEFQKRLYGLLDEIDTIPNAHYFVIAGASHTMMIVGAENIRHKSKVTLSQWLEWMVKEDPSWKSLRP